MHGYGLQELDRELAKTKEELLRHRKLTGMYQSAQEGLDQHRVRLRELEERLQQEALDVERLEGKGLVWLFHTVLGDRGSQLEQERQELLAAKLHYDAASVAVVGLEAEVVDLQRQLAESADPAGRYESLLERKAQVILEAEDPRAGLLLELAEQGASARADIRELEEAIQAGQTVLQGLEETAERLRSAKNWGVWDIVGGGLIATAAKHSKIDEARQLIHQVQEHLRRFGRELADVDAEAVAGIEISSFATFADFVLDGLISDWVVQARINRSLEGVAEMIGRVSAVIRGLEQRVHQVKGEAGRIEEERREMLGAVRSGQRSEE